MEPTLSVKSRLQLCWKQHQFGCELLGLATLNIYATQAFYAAKFALADDRLH